MKKKWILKKELITATSLYSGEGKSIATIQAEEHAQLIAAAPEMLEALEKIAEEAAREARNIGDSARRGDQSKADTFRFIRDEALKAIKEARGRS